MVIDVRTRAALRALLGCRERGPKNAFYTFPVSIMNHVDVALHVTPFHELGQ